MLDDLYSVAQFFEDDFYEYVRRYVGLEEAMVTAVSYTRRPAAVIGITRRVIITDADDYTVFEWKFGQGITWPPPADREDHQVD